MKKGKWVISTISRPRQASLLLCLLKDHITGCQPLVRFSPFRARDTVLSEPSLLRLCHSGSAGLPNGLYMSSLLYDRPSTAAPRRTLVGESSFSRTPNSDFYCGGVRIFSFVAHHPSNTSDEGCWTQYSRLRFRGGFAERPKAGKCRKIAQNFFLRVKLCGMRMNVWIPILGS